MRTCLFTCGPGDLQRDPWAMSFNDSRELVKGEDSADAGKKLIASTPFPIAGDLQPKECRVFLCGGCWILC